MPVLVQNGEKVRQMFEAFNRGDVPAILSNLHKDCIWEVMGQPEIPFAGIYHGPDDCRNFFNKLASTVDLKPVTPDHILEDGNTVIATGTMQGVIRKNNKPFSSLFCMINEFNEDGQVIHFRDCLDTLTIARAITTG